MKTIYTTAKNVSISATTNFIQQIQPSPEILAAAIPITVLRARIPFPRYTHSFLDISFARPSLPTAPAPCCTKFRPGLFNRAESVKASRRHWRDQRAARNIWPEGGGEPNVSSRSPARDLWSEVTGGVYCAASATLRACALSLFLSRLTPFFVSLARTEFLGAFLRAT